MIFQQGNVPSSALNNLFIYLFKLLSNFRKIQKKF